MGKSLKINKTLISAWCMYDWASAAFSIIVTTFIFSTYFTTKIAHDQIIGTYEWANAIAIAGILIAFTSPLVGSIADHGGYHKRWLIFFTSLAIVSSALLWFAYPKPSSIHFTLICVVFGTVGLEVALVFYNAYLPHIAPNKYLGRISGMGWGSGYIGGIVALTIALVLFIHPEANFFNKETMEQIRICGPFVAIWYIVFALPFFFLAQEIPSDSRPMTQAVRSGTRELLRTLKRLPQERNIFIYLISHMIYTDGLNTLFAFGGIYAAGTYGLSFQEVLLFGITMNVTAGLGAVFLGWADDRFGSKKTVMISLVCLSVFGIPLLLLHNKYYFWAVALFLCVFVGPVQSASRSLMVKLISDKRMSTEMFGLYALSGKITAFIGPWLLGSMTLYFDSQRVGMATVIVFFVVGALLLIPVKVEKDGVYNP